MVNMSSVQPPHIIQGSEMPVFSVTAEGGEDLLCSQCGASILIERYRPELFIDIRIECYRCGKVTATPPLPDGEILPILLMTMGPSGRYLFNSTVRADPRVAITWDEEIVREKNQSRPIIDPVRGLHLSLYGISSLEAAYDHLTGGQLEPQMASARRAIDAGHDPAKTHPFAWACLHWKQRLSQNACWFPEGILDSLAVGLMADFQFAINAWGHHPRFASLGKSFSAPSSFYHNIAVLRAALYLFSAGNRINLAWPDGGRTRTADLYLRSTPHASIQVEVKTPEALQFPHRSDLDAATIENIIIRCLKHARGQVSSDRQGLFVIASTLVFPGFRELLAEGIERVLTSKKHTYRGVAAIVGMARSYAFDRDFHQVEMNDIFIVKHNPSYSGQIKVRLA